MMNLKNVIIEDNIRAGPACYKLGLDAGYDIHTVFPGQFVMVQVPGQLEPLLRRPFSIYNVFGDDPNKQRVEVLYKVVGKGTEILSHMKKGEALNLLGPLGNGFAIPNHEDLVYVVAGGIGIAPMYFLMSDLLKKGWDQKNIVIFYGARTESEIELLTDFEKKHVDIKITTDDGTFGHKGFITERLESHLKKTPPDVMYACGPIPMLKAVALLADTYRVSCQVSLETTMACGMGACLGCAVKNSLNPDKYAHVCVDGPVFDLKSFRF